jgi:predicted nuclease with TOPRIM domain|nr:MAG TPA: Protein of unknown function (DUF724) [Caudoviricetes sp.]
MLKARKANRVVKIPDDKKDAYLALGYTISDMNDKPIAKPHNAEKEAAELKEKVSSLEAKLKEAVEYAEHADVKIDALEEENARLKEQVSTLEDKLKEAASKKATTGAIVGGSDVAKQASTAKQATK